MFAPFTWVRGHGRVAGFFSARKPARGAPFGRSRAARIAWIQFSQLATCNRLHSIEQRCCCWLLLTHDRVAGDEFDLTHEFLSEMLGTRRAGVTEIAAALQRAGLIRYTRGRITILDRKGLEKAACECYATVRGEFDRLVGH